MRPIWARNTPAPRGAGASTDALAEIEAQILVPLAVVMRAAGARDFDTEPVRPLVEAAEIDLIAGCDLARLGYFKQAYALWRAWFEQTFLALI